MPGDLEQLLMPVESMPGVLRVPTLAEARGRTPFNVAIRPPGSKSLTNRAILLASLCEGTSELHGALDADDSRRLIEAVRKLGARVEESGQGEARTLRITGVGGRWSPTSPVELFLNNAGTATRFLTAASVLGRAPIVIDGNKRMRERPISDLVDAVQQLGARARYLGVVGFPPVEIMPPAILPVGATVAVKSSLSSQFVSALMLIAPAFPGGLSRGLSIKLEGTPTSEPYIAMTGGLLSRFGAHVQFSGDGRLIRVGGSVSAFRYTVEPDASGATYFWAAAAVSPGSTCRVIGLDGQSLQGDCAFVDQLAEMGASVGRRTASASVDASIGVTGPSELRGVVADLSDTPDTAMTLAACACFARGPTLLRGLHTLRVKETDRIEALRRELGKLGVRVEPGMFGERDTLTIDPPAGGIDCSPDAPRVEFETYDDHRMAMSLAIIALRRPNTFIRDPSCVRKTYPSFWSDWAGLYK